MFYYLAGILEPWFGALNVLGYHTVRAGGAAVTGFLLCLVFGPAIIRRLRELKIGQYIKKDHVADLHALHKGKAGTPTMGGVMIIGGTLASLLLWGRLTNRLLWLAMLVILLLGTVGFIDDYIKLRRKHNDGLSARAKFIGQILTGLLLGVYLYFNPITVGAASVSQRDIMDWPSLAKSLNEASSSPVMTPQKRIWDAFPQEAKAAVAKASDRETLVEQDRILLMQGLNAALRQRDLFDPQLWPDDLRNSELAAFCARGADRLSPRDLDRMNRLLVEAALPKSVAASEPDLHTKIGVPGFKNLFIPLGAFYILFVIIVMVSISNAVNLTDGLDGLAAGAGIISILTYAGIAYIVSRADWSHYLFLTYVPEASELFVFGAALLGTGLGFLWFNGHPAEVFMGDTGSLALDRKSVV